MNFRISILLFLLVLSFDVTSKSIIESSTSEQNLNENLDKKPEIPDEGVDTSPKYWQAILGDICQLPSFPKATGDPTRYLECVRQNLAQDRKDIGIWTLRECVQGFQFVAAARRCKSIRSIKRQDVICSGIRSSDYDFCPNDTSDEFEIHETRMGPRRCSCPDGSKDCLCSRPEILEPVKVARRIRTTEVVLDAITPSLKFQSYQTNSAICGCNNQQQTNCCKPTPRGNFRKSTRDQFTLFTPRPSPQQQLPTPEDLPPPQPFQQRPLNNGGSTQQYQNTRNFQQYNEPYLDQPNQNNPNFNSNIQQNNGDFTQQYQNTRNFQQSNELYLDQPNQNKNSQQNNGGFTQQYQNTRNFNFNSQQNNGGFTQQMNSQNFDQNQNLNLNGPSGSNENFNTNRPQKLNEPCLDRQNQANFNFNGQKQQNSQEKNQQTSTPNFNGQQNTNLQPPPPNRQQVNNQINQDFNFNNPTLSNNCPPNQQNQNSNFNGQNLNFNSQQNNGFPQTQNQNFNTNGQQNFNSGNQQDNSRNFQNNGPPNQNLNFNPNRPPNFFQNQQDNSRNFQNNGSPNQNSDFTPNFPQTSTNNQLQEALNGLQFNPTNLQQFDQNTIQQSNNQQQTSNSQPNMRKILDMQIEIEQLSQKQKQLLYEQTQNGGISNLSKSSPVLSDNNFSEQQNQQTKNPNLNCQLTTTQQQYCPRRDQQSVIQPQPCSLVQGSATNARYQGICSWMIDPLAADPESCCHFLQCQPAPNNLFCGRWQRMPCAPATVFDVSSQLCVWNTLATPGPLPLPTPNPTTTTIPPPTFNNQLNLNSASNNYNTVQNTNFNNKQTPNNQLQYTGPLLNSHCNNGGTNLCKGGVQIGSCNGNYQCPGQSVCQISQMPNQRPCTACCYYKSMLMD